MKRSFIFLPVILILLITSCSPSPEEIVAQTATANTAIAASWTKTPTPTSTHTPTFTPTITLTSTMTPTITPTPLGGGSGQIACINCINGIFPSISLFKPDGTGAILVSDKDAQGHLTTWSRNGETFAFTAVRFIQDSEPQFSYSTCVIVVNHYNEQCDEIVGGFALSPDGTKMAIATRDKDDDLILYVYLIDVNSGEKRVLLESDVNNFGIHALPNWSPDGTTLAVAYGDIAAIDIKSGEKSVLVEGSATDYFGSTFWSPDGKKVVYINRNNIFVVNADSSNNTLVAKGGSDPIWSPDGTRIAYLTGYMSQQGNIIIMNTDGTNKVRLTPKQSLYGNGKIVWSSDGKYIVYLAFISSPYNPQSDIYSVDVESQKVNQLTNSHNILDFKLSPDGSAIAYTIGSHDLLEKGECFKSFVTNIDGTVLSEWKDLSCIGIVGPWRPTSSSSGNVSPTTTKGQSWEFETTGDTEGWMGINDLDPLQVSNGYLLTKSTGGDPYMYSPSIFLFDAVANSKIEISMKVSSGSLGQLFFITDTDTTYDESKSLRFNVKGDGQFHTYTLDMSRVKGWDGLIRQIRLDPTDTRATIEVDYVRISKP